MIRGLTSGLEGPTRTELKAGSRSPGRSKNQVKSEIPNCRSLVLFSRKELTFLKSELISAFGEVQS